MEIGLNWTHFGRIQALISYTDTSNSNFHVISLQVATATIFLNMNYPQFLLKKMCHVEKKIEKNK
jgi:hypothetical protein